MLFQISPQIAVRRDYDEVFKFLQDSVLSQFVAYVINSDYRKSIQLSPWIKEQINNPTAEVLEIASKIPIPDANDYDSIAIQTLRYVQTRLTYKGDISTRKTSEYWQTAHETVTSWEGDCFAGYEEIYTDKGLKKIEDIVIGDTVLSYDLQRDKYVYKKVTNHWSKGKLPIARVHFRNGQYVDLTKDHPMWVRINQSGKSKYEKVKLSEIDLTRFWKRKVPIARKIPYVMSNPKFHKDLYVVLGHYIAEGFTDGKSKVASSGYELISEIIPLLEKHNIPFTEYNNNSGVPCIRFLKSEFKDYLKLQKTNSFDIHLNEDVLTLPAEYLEALLKGMWLGDGTKYQYADKRGYTNNKEWTYSTSSKQLSDDIQRIGLHLGRTFHIWKQENHKGVGNKPIYRINYNPNSHFMQDFGHKDISEVSISYVEHLKETNFYDVTVEDTHTVILKNGIITHQCEDGAILIYVLCRINGIPANRLFLFAMDVKGGGHAVLGYKPQLYPLNFAFLDWCYWYSNKPITQRSLFHIVEKTIYEHKYELGNHLDSTIKGNYISLWFAFNEDVSYLSFKTKYQANNL